MWNTTRLFTIVCLMVVTTTSCMAQSTLYRNKIIADTLIKGTPAGGDTVATLPNITQIVSDSSIATPSDAVHVIAYWVSKDTLSWVELKYFTIVDGGVNPDTLSVDPNYLVSTPTSVTNKLAIWTTENILDYVHLKWPGLKIVDGGSNPDTLKVDTKLLPFDSTRTLPFGVQILGSLADTDTLSLGECDGATIDTIFYNVGRNAAGTTPGAVKFRLEVVDSLYATTNVELVDTASCTVMRRKEYGDAIDYNKLTAGKILRLIVETVFIEPKGIAIGIKGHYE